MKKIELVERKEIQMQILDAVDKFCEENAIKYSLACGTLLGAIRHGGYIPWDDDIDIYMLRGDFEKFEALFPDNYEGKYRLVSLKRNNDWYDIYSKVEDCRTKIVEKKTRSINIGINIDIFIIDEVPDDEGPWLQFNALRRKQHTKSRMSLINYSKDLSLLKNIAVFFLKLRYIGFNIRKYAEYRENFVTQYNGKGYNSVFETTAGMHCKRPFPKVLFDNIVEIPFEDRKFNCFKNYDMYLRATYGDNYMTPPPINKRVSLHTNDAFWI